ncbi:GNAT family N-acetyltransferase [Amycolatopsis thermophila]|uniref:Acetyltransferase n=1 Tax=Amycolatopsis thermophila TaxID=206084 RepID=A0ABU0F3X4_9PSEU|nr:GNAT family N-acetyltransferase [Amycolatopsis thermophila]MDQ0381742.1 putative acetyltransferase [Amycolatopsis thermophila]
MTAAEIRPLAVGEERVAFELLGRSLHATVTDEVWECRAGSFPAERRFAAFAGGDPVGVAGSFATRLAVPGGKALPAAAVDGVGVRADHTRRGILTALMAAQLEDCARRGDVVAVLHASETTIYGRFGYGVATRSQALRVTRAALRPDAPAGGAVRLLSTAEARDVVPRLYAGPALRPGMIERPDVWWSYARHRLIGEHQVAVHTGPDGDDGFVLYRTEDVRTFDHPNTGAVLTVRDLHAADTRALAGLWRFLLRVDLVSEIRAPGRPLGDPLRTVLTDPRAAAVTGLDDELWLRLVDVPAALAARTYGPGEPVVVEVSDPLLPSNTGRYRIGPEEVRTTAAEPELRMAPDVLAMLYLGDALPSALAAAGRIEVADAAALPRADTLFPVPVPPWCGTPF